MKVNRGILYGIGAYTMWGLLPVYWKALQQVPAIEILANRMLWSLLFVVALLTLRQHWRWLRPALSNRRILLRYIATSTLLAINWLTYIWAVNAGYLIETSLGYFINPLINVLLGMLFLQERLRAGQFMALSLAAGGVGYLTFSYGAFPWIAITLALSFGFYGLLRKTGKLPATEGLALETAVYFVPAALFLLYLNVSGTGYLANNDPRITLLLVGTGIVTGVPLLLFGAAAKQISLTNLGLLQYIAPTLQFLLGIFVYNESFSRNQLVGFSLIWLALFIYSLEGVRNNRYAGTAADLVKTPAELD